MIEARECSPEKGSKLSRFEPSKLLVVLLPLSCAALGLIRISPTDTPWHIISARTAFEAAGLLPSWLTTNTFSYTFPEFSLKQQYPIYQSLLYLVFQTFNFEGLSILHCLLWLGTFLLMAQLAGGLRTLSSYPLAWALVLLGLQRRMILRPDILTLPLLLLIMGNWERFDRGKIGNKQFLISALILQWALVNSHQMWPLGIAAIFVFWIDSLLLKSQRKQSEGQAKNVASRLESKNSQLFIALLACLGISCINPLGWEIFLVPLTTAGSLQHHRNEVTEFAAFGANLYPSFLVILAFLLFIYSCIRNKNRPRFYEIALLCGGMILALLALRGTVFAVGLCGLFAIRRLDQASLTRKPQHGTSKRSNSRTPYLIELAVGFSIPILLILNSHFGKITQLEGNQYGWGKSRGQWPSSSMEFLKQNPPEGEILNLSWYLGNSIIWNLYPRHRVFVDPRFESYPREFLNKTISAAKNFDDLLELIEQYHPELILLELRLKNLHKHAARLIQSGQWVPVAMDPQILILARNSSDTDYYAKRHGKSVDSLAISGFTRTDEEIYKLERARIRAFYSTISAKLPDTSDKTPDRPR
jgi:hypothetical membrane protein